MFSIPILILGLLLISFVVLGCIGLAKDQALFEEELLAASLITNIGLLIEIIGLLLLNIGW